jgi:hypothetical protein
MDIKHNPLKPVIEIELLKFKEGIRHIQLSLDRGHITKDQAHDQMNKLASIYADHITHLADPETERSLPHRYLVQFCHKGIFTTDCGFRDGQLARAKAYVRIVVNTLDEVSEGIVFDRDTNGVAWRYVPSQEPEASEQLINAVFGEPEAFEDPNGSDGVDDDPFVQYQGPDDPEIRYR